MPEVTIVYWRDIPAQVIVGSGRRAAKVPLPERFEQAIDRAAMRSGAKDEDAYIAEWRKRAHQAPPRASPTTPPEPPPRAWRRSTTTPACAPSSTTTAAPEEAR